MKFSFLIDGTIYEREISKMFIDFGNVKVFEITRHANYWFIVFEWEIGGFFLQNYISNFNYEENIITFYEYSSNKEELNVDSIILGNICLLSVFTVFLIVIYYKQNKLRII